MRKALAAVAVLALAGASLGSAAPPAGKIRIEPRPGSPTTGDTTPRGGTHLLLQVGAFDPLREELELSRVVSARAAEPGYGIVQLQPGRLAAKEALEKLGVKLYGYLPDNAFQVRLDARSRALLAALPEVRWVGEYQPGYKIHPRFWKDAGDVTPEMSVYAFPGESVPLLAAEIAKRAPGAVEISRLEDPAAPRLRYSVPVSQRPAFLDLVASIAAVSWIEPYDVPQLHNNNALGPVQSNTASSIAANACTTCSIFGRNLTGTGQIVAVADSGCDSDMCFFRLDGTPASITDADSPVPPALGLTWPAKKVFAYWVQPGATAYDNNAVCTTSSTSFHGTHTSGTVVGDNFASPSTATAAGINTADGMAPNAKLLFQDVGHDTTGCLSGLNDSFSMFLQAKNGGARAHSNSYGSSTAGAYTGEEQNVDRFLFDNEEMTIFFSAGNDGSGAQTGGSPGNAKNIVTVGALGNGNSTTVAGFSSRGPTADGRIKPDIQAPGSSTVSAGGNTNHADGNCGTSSLSGTSMSCPTVAGASALLRQYFESGIYPTGTANAADAFSPGAALVKAVLLNGTRPLPDNSTFGNNNYGWGRVFLDNNLYFAGDPRRLRVWNVGNRDGLTTGQSATYTIDVPAGQELRVTLAWLDAEATLGSAVTLVNNLNLTVTGPGGTFLGNVFTGTGVSTTGGTADAKNTVEQVRFPAPTAGTYTITITGAAVPGNGRSYTNRQGFAVAASFGSGCATAVVAAPTGLGVTSNATMGADLTFTPAAASTLTQIYRAPGTCAAPAGAFQYIGGTATGAFTDGRAQGGLTYAYKVRGADLCSEGPVSTCVSITPTGRCDLVPDFAGLTSATLPGTQCRVALSWGSTAAACPSGGAVRYNVYRSTTPGFTPAPGDRIVTTSATAYNDDTVSPGSTYYYIVRAEDTSAGGTGPNGGNEEQNTKQLYATPLGANGAVGTFTDDGGDTQAKLTGQTPWRIVTNQAQAGGRSYHPGPAAGPYPGSTCAALVTPALELTTGSSLSYWARYNLEYQWDGVVVEISTNGGASWADLPPAGGYPSTLAQTQTPPINACGYPSSQG
ncbi:MAG: S8 family serine peptidase, partial [Acidobacteria bacterium]|nr:S8 family serine peptidase [Acidobacteriota bacterium]